MSTDIYQINTIFRHVLKERQETPSGQLSYSDIFYRKITLLDSIVWGLLEAQEEVCT